ncbi:flagellar assembly factor FliW [Caloranaerobacter azorensis DSM 13643]|uniref:Flagellar assembly factor FliW n=1 Tax=Caloranaerobacter azorensis DSM 13643 TaxID=1121264 RepID=A0A1M5V3I9_9FIRM|nr:flagellar assembly protein FliW [Caloranaerobacter azorensis]SHH69837.1 flagellar assembly factor FliW [Caloranaerobacter azorensis DSM 13643]
MLLNTKHFGQIEIDEDSIITFPDGLLAFEEQKRFVIINNPDEEIPFKWLQSIDNPDLAFVIVNPFLFKRDYEFDIPQSVVDRLDIEREKDVLVYSIVVVPEDITKMTANLVGPIIINLKNRLAKQIILDDKRYTTKHLILDELGKLNQEV